MADTKPDLWHGIPREEIPWRPNVDPAACEVNGTVTAARSEAPAD